MKVIAKYKDMFYGANGEGYITFKIENLRHVNMLREIDKENLLSLDVDKAKDKRSIQQNSYLWALLTAIDKKINGNRSDNAEEIYIQVIDKAGAKSDYIVAVKEAEQALKNAFRVVKYIKPHNETSNVYKVYYGSSTYDTKEMTILIETALDYAATVGIDTDYWTQRFDI